MALTLFLSLVSEGRLLVFAIKDEGTFQLRQPARTLLARLGSKYSSQVLYVAVINLNKQYCTAI